MEFSTRSGRLRRLAQPVPKIGALFVRPSFGPVVVDGREVREVVWLDCGCCCIVVELDGREWAARQ